MKENKQKRISFDIPEEIHNFLKIECAKSRIALRDLMKEITLKTVEEIKKKDLNTMLRQGFQDSYEGKGTIVTQEKLNEWNSMIGEDE